MTEGKNPSRASKSAPPPPPPLSSRSGSATELQTKLKCSGLKKEQVIMLLLHSTSKAQRRQEISVAVQEDSGIPNVIGVIDGTHIRIRAPMKHPEVYVNRKKFHSLNVQVSLKFPVYFFLYKVTLRCSLVVGYCAII